MDPDIAKFFGVMMTLVVAGVGGYAGIIIVNGLTRRLNKGDPAVGPEELEYLRDKAEQVDLLAERVAELETRLDFAERVLTRPEESRHDTPVGSN